VGALTLMAVAAGGFVGLFTPVQSSTSTAVAEVMRVDDLLYLVTGDLTSLRIQQPGSFAYAELEAARVQDEREVAHRRPQRRPTQASSIPPTRLTARRPRPGPVGHR
jgi:hypothetical protein